MSDYSIKLEKFEGPLDLLLNLIEEEKLEITEISLAKVTDQFIQYVNNAEDLDPGQVADFLVVASKLLLIKSRVLIPSLEFEEEDEESLEKQLKIYKQYYDASKKIRQLLNKNRFMFARTKQIRVFTPKFSPPANLTPQLMSGFFEKIVKRLEPVVKLPQEAIRRTVSIKEKINQIKDFILSQLSFNFKKLINQGDKTEVVVSFLAMLELVKQRLIIVDQDGLFMDITVKKNGN